MKTLLKLPLPAALAALALAGCATQQASTSSSAPSACSTSQQASAQPAASGSVEQKSAAAADHSVYYAFDKYDITTNERPIVEANAQYLKAHPDLKVRIEGNADERGSREYNLALGQKRADGVEKALSLLGVSDGRMETVSYGKEKPKASGHDEQAWAQNRRSDIVYP